MKANLETTGLYPEHVYEDAYIRNGKVECENEVFYGIFDKDDVEIYSESFPFGKAKRLVERLNINGEFKPYTMKKVGYPA